MVCVDGSKLLPTKYLHSIFDKKTRTIVKENHVNFAETTSVFYIEKSEMFANDVM